MHNIGRLRYPECTAVCPDGTRAWLDIRFPYDPGFGISYTGSSRDIVCTSRFSGEPVFEVYRSDSDGIITVELRRPFGNESRCCEIWHT